MSLDENIEESTENPKSAERELKVEEANEDDKENSATNTEPSNGIRHQTSPSLAAKLVLEKSLSLSMFPDAPTTPKVCRKTLYDDEDDLNTQVKEIVKKYQTNEKRHSCCSSETAGECVLCNSANKPPSLELDKGIIC